MLVAGTVLDTRGGPASLAGAAVVAVGGDIHFGRLFVDEEGAGYTDGEGEGEGEGEAAGDLVDETSGGLGEGAEYKGADTTGADCGECGTVETAVGVCFVDASNVGVFATMGTGTGTGVLLGMLYKELGATLAEDAIVAGEYEVVGDVDDGTYKSLVVICGDVASKVSVAAGIGERGELGLSIENLIISSRRDDGLALGDDEVPLNELDEVFKFDIFSLASLSSKTHKMSFMFFLILSSFVEEDTKFK